MTQQLNQSTIAITGAAQGLGFTMACHLAQLGAHVLLLDKDEDKLKSSYQVLKEAGAAVHYYVLDVVDEKAVCDTFNQIAQDHQRLDGFINNAGIINDSLLIKVKGNQLTEKMSLSAWQQVIDVNLTGVFLCGREAASLMATQEPSSQQSTAVIINISSISRAGNIGQSNYAASKAGVVALTTTWAKELARYHIRVAAIAPGFMETEMTQQMKPEAIERVTAHIPLRKLGSPNHIAQTVEFILNNDYVSGRVFEIDGGLRI